MLAALTSARSAVATLATRVGLRRRPQGRQLSESQILACIVAEAQDHARREQDRLDALAAVPALVDQTRAYMRMVLRQRAVEGDAFALAALRTMAA